jgi:hypothetical protein
MPERVSSLHLPFFFLFTSSWGYDFDGQLGNERRRKKRRLVIVLRTAGVCFLLLFFLFLDTLFFAFRVRF